MFQWNVTSVINSAIDAESGNAKVAVVAPKDRPAEKSLRICRVTELKADGITKIYKNEHKPAVPGSVAVDVNGTQEGEVYRIKLYARLSGSQNSYYANDFVFKGKPFIFEFKGGMNAEAVAKLINKIKNLYGDKFLKVEAEGTSVKFTGDNYTMFTEAVVEKFTHKDNNINGGEWDLFGEEAEPVACENGFGTYEQILKDLRLPTMDNTGWSSINAEEMPVPGAAYDQYTIHYCKDRGVMGTDAVGDNVTSTTTHVLYVKQGLTFGGKTIDAILAETGVTVEPAKKSEEAGE